MESRNVARRLPLRCLMLTSLMLVVIVSAGHAQQAQPFEYEERILENGLRVISLEDFSCPIVAVHLWYHVGSKDESPERQGFAHMFEHMMFRGTDKLGPTDHVDLIRKTGGTSNAYTTFDQTVYTQTLPANQLNLALWLEAERMSMLKIDQESFDTERKVVEEERRMGLNRPYGRMMEQALPYLFPDHPYRWSTIGSIPHLRAASVPELREFWTTYYVPNNATLVVVGAVKHAEVQQLAERNFGWIPRCKTTPRIATPEWKPFQAQQVVLKAKNAPAPLVGLVYRGIPLNHPDATAIDLMTTILGGGESSRLYRRIVADDELAVMAISGGISIEQSGVIAVGSVLSPVGGKPEPVLKAMREEIQRLQSEPVAAAELHKARNQMLRSLVTESLTVDSKASALGSAAVLEGDLSRINTRLERIRKVTPEDIQQVALKYLDLNHAITGRVNRNLLGTIGGLVGIKGNVEDAPVTGTKETDPPAPGRQGVTRPASRLEESPIAAPLNYALDPRHQELTLDNGLKIIVVQNHEIPFVSVQLGLDAGAWTESKPGSASMALAMLTKGTANHSEKELSEELESHAISLSGSASMDTAAVGMNCLPEQLNRGIRLMADVVLEPTMPEQEFKKLLKQARTGLIVSAKEPSNIANREFRRRLYGSHPYSRSATGEVADLDALTPADLQAWWKRFARPDMATLIFAGDVDLARAGTLAKEYFSKWQAQGPRPALDLPPLPEPEGRQVYLVDNQGVQSQIRVGHLSFTRSDPVYVKSRVLNGYFGGAFSSRLNESIRIQKGLTYGASGGFDSSKMAGTFRVGTFSKNASTVEAVEAILEEISRLQRDGPTEKELNDTISYVVGAYPADRETPQQVAGDIWFRQSMNLPTDYFEQLLKGVSETTAEDCLKIAQEKISLDNLTIVVVGPAKILKEGLEKIAPVTVVSDK